MFNLTIGSLITNAIVLLVAVVVHEYAHTRVAYAMGDDTAARAGRMTLDPRANVWWPGYFIGVLIGFAILGSAPVNPYRMRNRRWGMFAAVAAGPISNLLLAVVFSVPFWFGVLQPELVGITVNGQEVFPSLNSLFTWMVYLNVLLFVFNLLPLAPLDGWTMTLSALPPQAAIWWERYKQESQYILFGLIILSFISGYFGMLGRVLNVLSWLIGTPTTIITQFLLNPF